jgi:hypothetical protein
MPNDATVAPAFEQPPHSLTALSMGTADEVAAVNSALLALIELQQQKLQLMATAKSQAAQYLAATAASPLCFDPCVTTATLMSAYPPFVGMGIMPWRPLPSSPTLVGNHNSAGYAPGSTPPLHGQPFTAIPSAAVLPSSFPSASQDDIERLMLALGLVADKGPGESNVASERPSAQGPAPTLAELPPSFTHLDANRAVSERRQVIVKFISDAVTDSELHALCERFGPVENARVVMDRTTGRTRGYAFVIFKHPEHARLAVTSLAGYPFHGRHLSAALTETARKRAF